MEPKISVIILTWNGAEFLEPCLGRLLNQGHTSLDVIVVDNGSTDDSVAVAARCAPQARIIRNQRNLGFAGGNNVGIQASDSEIVVLLNPDTVVQPGWLAAIVDTFQDSTIGVVGCKALYPDGRTIQHAGGVLEHDGAYAHHIGSGELDNDQYDRLIDCEYVTGAAMGIHRRVIDKIGGLDEEFFPAFYEEVDYCYRARRAGFRVVYQPKAVLYHHETASLPARSFARRAPYHRNRVRFVLRNWPFDRLESFAAAELVSIAGDIDPDALLAHAQAYLENALNLSAILMERRRDKTLGGALTPNQEGWLRRSMRGLRWRAIRRLYSLTLDGSVGAAKDFDATASHESELLESLGFFDLHEAVRDLESQDALREPTLSSKTPLLGPVIDWLREIMISAVVRHYVLPILSEQIKINAHIIRVIRGLSRVQQIMVADEAAILERIEKDSERNQQVDN